MPVTVDRPRFTIFGWFLTPGKLYKVKSADVVENATVGGHGKDKGVKDKAVKDKVVSAVSKKEVSTRNLER
ncbi:hypothetical protein T484DRAFT_1847808 [Baffinella frigidus]|nr:hypothetical protein T484DRAFT_1847808 [Cryptophyta sp. CCMP2293]